MADHPFRFRPPLLGLVHPEQVDVPVQVALQVRRVHAGEPPEVALDPGAEVVHHRHALQVDRVLDVGLVRLARAFVGGKIISARLPLVTVSYHLFR